MLKARSWEKSQLSRLLKEVIFTPAFMNIVESYLGFETLEYYTLKQLAKTKKLSEPQLKDLLEKFAFLFRCLNNRTGILEDVLGQLSSFFEVKKGAMAVQVWLEYSRIVCNYDSLTALRTLRFAELVLNKAVIDPKNMLFWEPGDKCIGCLKLKQAVLGMEENSDWQNTRMICQITKCPVKPNASLDHSILKYFQMLEEKNAVEPKQTKNQVIIADSNKTIEKQLTSDIPELMNISPGSKKLFDYMVSNKTGVSDAKLRAYGKINNLDAHAAISEINGSLYEHINREILKLDEETRVWSVDVGYLHNMCDANPKPLSSIEASVVKFPYIQVSEAKLDDFLDTRIYAAFKSAFANIRTSYKFYWAHAILFCIEKNKNVVSLKDMATLMCAYAWDDVIQGRFSFAQEDYLPFAIKNVQTIVSRSKTHSIETLFNELQQRISSYDVKRLTASVKDYFFAVYYRIEENDSQNEASFNMENELKEHFIRSRAYECKGSYIYIDKDFFLDAIKYSSNLREFINTAKEHKLTSKL